MTLDAHSTELSKLPIMKPSRISKNISPRGFLVAFFAALAGVFQSPAFAAEGPAPASEGRRVIAGVHADVISVFAENDGLVLGARADVDGGLGVRLEPNLTTFNVEESRRTTVSSSPGLAFLGTPGSDVWIAPESNPISGALWPGFSTEGVPSGYVDADQITLRLNAVTGPGTLHIYQSSPFGDPGRLFSSIGSDYREWTLNQGSHAHANWAFSAAGTYTLTFIASAVIDGVPISTTQNYVFVVGNVPAAVTTTTTLEASTNSSPQGAAVTLTSAVTPANAVGWVEFLDGSTVLGHDAVNAGAATLTTTNLTLGARSVTARFVPQWLNDFSASSSAPVAISVTGSGIGESPRATFDRSVGILFGNDLNDMRLEDIDNDGDPDVLFADRIETISIALNNGDGTFGAPHPLPAINYSRIHVADLNGDNLPEIFTTVYVDDTYTETVVAIWRNLGSGNFSAKEIVATTRTSNVLFLAGAGDIDGDGLNDLILSGNTANGVSYSRNLGAGSFGPLTEIFPGGESWAYALEDMDEDNDLDLVRMYNDNSLFRLQLFRNSGATVPAFTNEEIASFPSSTIRKIAVGDTDQNGSADIHLLKQTSTGSEVVVLRGTSSGTFLSPVTLVSSPELTDLKLGNIDGNARLDLALTSRDSNRVLFAQNLGSGVFTGLQEFTTDGTHPAPGHEVVEIGDVDGDGRKDLVYMERFPKRIAWSRNRQGENINELLEPQSRTYLNGYPMTFDVFFGFNLLLNTTGGSPTLPVTIGSQTIQVPFIGQPNANTLRFRYQVGLTDLDLDGIEVANSMVLNGAAITDVQLRTLDSPLLQFPPVDTTGIRVNGAAPYASGIMRLDPNPAAASSVRYAVTFSEPVTGVDVADFSLDAVGPTGASITSVTGNGDSYVVTANIGSGDGTLKLRALDDDSISDVDSNPLGGVGAGSGEFAYGQGYTVRSSTATPEFNNVIKDGHLDISLLLYEGEWYAYWNGEGFWETHDTLLSAGPESIATRPADASWDFLGVPPGEPVWIFPETYSTTTPWPGVGAYDNQADTFASYLESDPRVNATSPWIKMQLLAVRGPEGGKFSLYQNGVAGPMVFMTTANGIGADDAAWISNLSHVHYNWAFTKPGLYQVDVAVSAFIDFNQNITYEPGIDPLSESQVVTLHFGVDIAGQWRLENFGSAANTGSGANDQDFDSDGTSNLLEYAFGLNPTASSPSPLSLGPDNALVSRGVPAWVRSDSQNYAVFLRRKDRIAARLEYAVETSSNLSAWQTLTATPEVIGNEGEMEIVRVPIPAPGVGETGQFMRVNVTSTP
jgi:surface-anchored protein